MQHQIFQQRAEGSNSLARMAVIILGGGEGKRLQPLTNMRCKPAVSFGGRYALIDIPISHALLSGCSQIYVLGQYKADSLHHHLSKTYQPLLQKEIQLLLPEAQKGGYEGTADAVRKNLDHFFDLSVDYFLILSGDQLYNIDFQKMIQCARECDASMMIASKLVCEEDAKRMGLLRLASRSTKLNEFVEKPKEKALLDHFSLDELTLAYLNHYGDRNKRYLGSMGIYLFKRQALLDLLCEDGRADFGEHLIKTEMAKGQVHAYVYHGYWEDIGTIAAYYKANLALTEKGGAHTFDCYNEENLILTQSYHLPGAKVSNCHTTQSVLCEGSIIEASEISNSIVGVRSQVGKGVVIEDAILVGNSFYERGDFSPRIGEGCQIRRAIIDENVSMGQGVELLNLAGYTTYDHPEGLLHVRDGVIIVPGHTHLPNYFTF